MDNPWGDYFPWFKKQQLFSYHTNETMTNIENLAMDRLEQLAIMQAEAQQRGDNETQEVLHDCAMDLLASLENPLYEFLTLNTEILDA